MLRVCLHALTQQVCHPKVELGQCVALPGGLLVVVDGQNGILSQSKTRLAHGAKLALRLGVTLGRRRPIPLGCSRIVLHDALPSLVHRAKLVLRFGQALVSGQLVPLQGFCVVLWHAPAVCAEAAQVELCLRVPQSGS